MIGGNYSFTLFTRGTSESYNSRVFIPRKLNLIRSNYSNGYDPVKNSRNPLTYITNWLLLSFTFKFIKVSSITFFNIILRTSSALVTNAASISTVL